MSDKVYLGLKTGTLETAETLSKVSRINLSIDSGNMYTSGTDDGRTTEVSIPWGTQAMADHILAGIKDITYRPYTAEQALLDPAAEIGDAITVGGIYSAIYQTSITFDRQMTATVSAPTSDETEDEYPYQSKARRKANRQLAQTHSLIAKTAEQIRLEVANKVEGLSSSFTVELDKVSTQIESELDELSASFTVSLDSITSRVNGLNGKVTEFEQTANSLTARMSNAETGLSQTVRLAADGVTITNSTGSALTIDGGQLKAHSVTADEIDATSLKVASANITGSLTIGQLPSSVATMSDIPTDVSELTNDAGYQTKKGVVTIVEGTVTADYVEALEISAASLASDEIYIYGRRGRAAGSITTTEAASYSGRKLVIDSGALELSAGYGSLYLSGGSGAYMDIDDIISCGGDVIPSGGLRYALGSNAYKWTDLYCANGTIITSDREAKKEIIYGLDKYDGLFDQLLPCSYQLIGGESGRRHFGMIAQDLEGTLDACKIPSTEFAGFIKSPKQDENGTIVEGEYDYALRYTEFIPLLIWQVQKLKVRVSELEGLQ